MTPSAETSADLRCHRCGYDLRAHPPDGKCPECGTTVAESKQEALTPRRPAWQDSDPRWRRRMLAGVWVLVLLPLMDVLHWLGWDANVPALNLFGYGAIHTLSETLISWPGIYAPLIFCIGVVLLFSKERGRRRNRLDWTRRWGVFSSYIVFVLSAVEALAVPALVLVGIAALFLSMGLKYQPRVTQLVVDLSTGYLRYGPWPNQITLTARVGVSAIVMLLACIPLFDALRSSGGRRLVWILLAPLALFALYNFAQAVRLALGVWHVPLFSGYVDIYGIYFWPQALAQYIWPTPPPMYYLPRVTLTAFLVEAIKWCIILTIAVWLSIAQIASCRRRRKKAP
jgi:hypothetical protein